MTQKNLGGRPRKIASPAEMDRLVDEYVADRLANDQPITLLGLILHLGLNSRQSLDEYLAYDGFPDSVKRAKAIVEHEYEIRLINGGGAGAIFALKNFGWKDKQEVENSGGMTLTIETGISRDSD
jgi:hypothetical protein